MKMKKIKAIIFDLDNTLFNAEPITEMAIKQAINSMIDNGLKCSLGEGIERMKKIIKENPFADKFKELAKSFGQDNEYLINKGKEIYYNKTEFNKLDLYPGSIKTLKELKKRYKLILVTSGGELQQNRKIDALNIRKYFDYISIDEKPDKEIQFLEILKNFRFIPKDFLVVGDRIDNEIKIANKLGMNSVLIKKGKYSSIRFRNKFDEPDYIINNISEILYILDYIDKRGLKIVAIGGGTGLPTIIRGLRKYTEDLTMVVGVTDSGRSSGILRREMNILPPGDLRNCLIALSNSEKLMSDLFLYRFENESLKGHSLGNLLIAALTKITGDFEQAIEKASEILELKGRVLPSTLDNIHLCAKLYNDTIIEEEDNLIDRDNSEVYLRSPIKEVFLKPLAKANKKVIEEILQADLIVLCPGSLFTSLITNLLVEGISEAIKESPAKKVYICNLMSQVSQTYGYKASDHVKQIIKYLGIAPDYVILNTKKPDDNLIEPYKKEKAHMIEADFEEIEKLGIKIIGEDLLEDTDKKESLWNKKYLLRHNPDKTAELLISLI